MTQLHAWSALAAVAGLALVAVVGAVAAATGRGSGLAEQLRWAALSLAALAAGIGLILLVGGRQPAELLHILYGVALVAVLPLGASFAADAPPAPRAGVIAGAAVVGLLLAWRLVATG